MENFFSTLNISRCRRCLLLPDSCQMAVIVDYVKVRHSAVALLLARLVFKVLQGHTLCESVNTQDFGRLGKKGQMLTQNTNTNQSKTFFLNRLLNLHSTMFYHFICVKVLSETTDRQNNLLQTKFCNFCHHVKAECFNSIYNEITSLKKKKNVFFNNR